MLPGATMFFERLRGRPAAQALPVLVQRLLDGEDAAIGTAYDLHHERVRAFARRLLGDAAAADDLVQEVFVTLPSAIRRFRGESTLETFLLSIAINHARHHLRAAERRRKALLSMHREPAAHGPSAERVAVRQQLARSLLAALDDLPLDQRAAFVLCDVEERTSVEAAAVLGVPDTTVRTRLFHARRKLRARMIEEGHHDGP